MLSHEDGAAVRQQWSHEQEAGLGRRKVSGGELNKGSITPQYQPDSISELLYDSGSSNQGSATRGGRVEESFRGGTYVCSCLPSCLVWRFTHRLLSPGFSGENLEAHCPAPPEIFPNEDGTCLSSNFC